MANEMSDIKATAQIAMRNGALAPQNFEGLWRMSQIMAASGFMPKGMERVESVFVAVQFGMEVGLSPMQAVQNIAPINGRPAIWGDAMLGLVRASGYMESIKEDLIGSGDAMEAVCQVWRKGEDNPVTHRFSVADAKRAGLWQTSPKVERRRRDGGGTYQADNDSPWWKYPRRMLQMRARGFCLRDAFPDVLKGLYSREELEGVPERYMGSAVIAETSSIDEALLAEAAKRQAKEATAPAQESGAEPGTAAQQEEVPKTSGWPRANEDGELVDVRGIPWIEAAHSANKTCTTSGEWRQKRGADPHRVAQLEAEAMKHQAEEPAGERSQPATESGGAGFSFETLMEEAEAVQTEEDRDQVLDLMRGSKLTEEQYEQLTEVMADNLAAASGSGTQP